MHDIALCTTESHNLAKDAFEGGDFILYSASLAPLCGKDGQVQASWNKWDEIFYYLFIFLALSYTPVSVFIGFYGVVSEIALKIEYLGDCFSTYCCSFRNLECK